MPRTPTRHALAIGACWVLTRGACLALLATHERWVLGDITYYADSFRTLDIHGLPGTLVEYPLAAVALLAIPWSLAHLIPFASAFTPIVVILLFVPDAVLTWLLARHAHPGRNVAVGVWLVAPVLLGVTSYARFDMVPGVLAAVALLLIRTHPRLGAVAAAVAVTLKLWPIVLVPGVILAARRRLSALTAGLLVAVLAVGATIMFGGISRLLSLLLWQSDRGLQIESVAATPAILAWGLGAHGYAIGMSSYHADEVTGPGVALLAEISATLTVVGFALVALLFVRAWARRAVLTDDGVVWLCLAAVLAPIVTSKVLSPQYLLWVLPLAAAGHVLVHNLRRPGRSSAGRWPCLSPRWPLRSSSRSTTAP